MNMSDREILKKFGEAIKVEPVTKEFTLNSFDLLESASDKEIEAALGENHLFEAGEVYTLIGNLVSKQSKGEEGALLANGYSNLFYISSCVVIVHWSSYGQGWYVYAWRRSYYWRGGRRVFSPATKA